MTRYRCSTSLAVFAAGLAAGAGPAWAADNGEPFDVAEVFFELNNTDGDLGIHALIDGEPWKRLAIDDMRGRRMLNIRVTGRLRRQGLTELFFESAEPTFDELPPQEFFDRFPEGTYEVEGVTLDGVELESEAVITHLLPAPPLASVNGDAASDDCETNVPPATAPMTISWEEVTMSHPDLGRTNEPIDVVQYQVVVEREEPTPLNISVILDPGATLFAIPDGLLGVGEQIKYEVLVREASGNQTALESCFTVTG